MNKKSVTGWMLATVAAGLYMALRIYWIRHRYFMVDETQHLHAAWCMAQGQLPYKDFFEHHGPVIWFLLQPVVRFFHAPLQALYAARGLMQILWLAIIGLYVAMARKEWTWPEKALAVFVLCSFSIFARHSYECRPDMPATVILGLLYVIGLRHQSRWTAVVLGLCVATGLLTSPKFIFPGGSFVLGWLYFQYGISKKPLSAWWAALAKMVIGAALPLFIVGWWLGRHHVMNDFVYWFFMFNSRNKGHFALWPEGHWLPFKENIMFWILAFWGWADHRREGPLSIAFVGATLILLSSNALILFGYTLVIAPLTAWFASTKLIELTRAKNERTTAAIFFLGLLASYYIQMHGVLRNDEQLTQWRCVEEHTRPSDRVLSFEISEAVLRPHASFYWWITPDIDETLGRPLLEERLLQALADPRTAAVIWDDNILAHHPVLQAGIRQRFTPAACGRLWLRNPPSAGS